MKKNNSTEIGGIAALVIGTILCAWMSLVAGVKTCGGMIISMLKSVRRFITAYLRGTDEDRENLVNSLKSTLISSTMALAIVLVAGLCINTLFDALIRTRLAFIPEFLLNAIGYLCLGILLRAVVRVCEKMSVRSDVTVKARKFIEFSMSALVPFAVWSFVSYATKEGIYLIFSCCIAIWGYRRINKMRAAKAMPATN